MTPAICETCGASAWGTRNRCKPCRARSSREQWARNVEASRGESSTRKRAWRAANPEKSRAQDLRKRYGLDATGFEALLVAQRRRCPICRAPEPDCVDHCHTTGRVRGILCRSCNIALGYLRDDPSRLRAAIRYLQRPASAGNEKAPLTAG